MNQTKRPIKCPDCGRPASGKFCVGCGAALKGAKCPRCASSLSFGSKFCSNCGHALGATQRPAWYGPAMATLAAVVVLGVAALFTIGPFGPGARASRVAPGLTPAPSDLSILPASTPRGEADRLFDQAMRAHEGGDSLQAASVGSMAVGAYARLPERDADARFHIGLLHEITHNYDAILAQADSIALSSPNHLFAYLLRHRVYSESGNSQAANDTYRGFLEVYDLEIAAGREEYEAHGRLVESFRSRAQQAVGN